MTILGTRPEIIRLSLIIKKLDQLCEHVLVHTGQNYESSLSELFFQELGVREPDYYLGVQGETFGKQLGAIISAVEAVIIDEAPDRILFLGDTNSSLSAIAAKRLKIPVYHMEAGNRCYDDRVPEEVNRRIIDHCSDILMPYTERSRMNLLREGFDGEKIFVTGNPILEVLTFFDSEIESSNVLNKLKLKPGSYFLVTLHRAENVDEKERLINIIDGLKCIHAEYNLPVICSTHPRTRFQLESNKIEINNNDIVFVAPLGLFDFIKLEKNAMCVLSDSGTVQEECCIFGVPSVTLRDVTERPETMESGSNILSGAEPKMIVQNTKTALSDKAAWQPPKEYLILNVSQTVVKILMSYKWNGVKDEKR